MNTISNMDVQDFVRARFSEEQAIKLENISRGGENNKKGADFEGHYATHTIAIIGASASMEEWANHHISCQEQAFVDDLCVRDRGTGRKINYQAKNSEGTSADWTEEMRTRFEMQAIIDTEHHCAGQHEQVLIVSSEAKAAINGRKIPQDMQSYCRSEYFPYEHSSIELLMTHPPLREALTTLCASCNLGRLDEAFRIMLGQWHADNRSGRTVLDVLSKAKACSRPDIFGGFRSPFQKPVESEPMSSIIPPSWLTTVLERFKMGVPEVECTVFKVSYNGLEVKVAINAAAPTPERLASLASPRDVLLLLMSVEAGMLAALQPTRGNPQ